MNTRREARERALQLLYQLEIQRDDPEGQIIRYLDHVTFAPKGEPDRWEADEYPTELGRKVSQRDKDFIAEIVNYVTAHKIELDELYKVHLKGWKLERIPIVDQCIMRLAVYEITERPDIPFSVSVNEAVLLAKKYADDKSRSYINAILGKMKSVACEKTADKKKSVDQSTENRQVEPAEEEKIGE
ncbi:MAG: transcription antitermination factor NusB [Fastidiosipilaceae bacterium]|nr:transcription antitermination factor NusB [Clostridiaceae bacterium]